MSHIPFEKIAILDFSCGEVFIYPISEREESEHFLERKGFKESEVQWMRGDIKVHIENEEANN